MYKLTVGGGGKCSQYRIFKMSRLRRVHVYIIMNETQVFLGHQTALNIYSIYFACRPIFDLRMDYLAEKRTDHKSTYEPYLLLVYAFSITIGPKTVMGGLEGAGS